MEYQIYQIFLFFSIYAILGFIINTLYRALAGETIVNTRVCKGPYCPTYGFGALALIFTMGFYQNNPLVAFAAGAIIGTVIEIVTVILIRIYSGVPLEKFTWYHPLLWGIGGMILITHFHPLIELATNRISPWIHFGFLVVFLITCISDYFDRAANFVEGQKGADESPTEG